MPLRVSGSRSADPGAESWMVGGEGRAAARSLGPDCSCCLTASRVGEPEAPNFEVLGLVKV